MGQTDQKTVFATALLASGTAALVGTLTTGWLPGWANALIVAVLAAGLTATVVRLRLLGPMNALHADLRSNLLGSSEFFDTEPCADNDPGDETRDPMLRVIDRFQQITEQMADHGNRIAIHAAEVSSSVQILQSDLQTEDREVRELSVGINRIEGAMNALAQSAAQAAVCASRASQAGSASQRVLSDAALRADTTMQQTQLASNRLAALADKSDRIEQVCEMIVSVAEQTELLALNAVNEAARVGEQGRGFALAANEVRGLAQDTSAATNEISGMLAQLGTEVRAANTTIAGLTKGVAEGVTLTAEAGQHLADVRVNADTAHERMQAVTEGASANWNELVHISACAKPLAGHLKENVAQAREAAEQAEQLSSVVETIHGQVVTLGGHSQHAHMRFVAQSVAQSIGQAFELGIEEEQISESVLFGRVDATAGETEPPDRETRFDGFADQVLPTIQEPVLELNPELTYLGIVDRQGYFPAQNRRYTGSRDGDSRTDTADDRATGFGNQIDQRCSGSTEPFLLQTYKDEGAEVMHDISAPIHVNGRHWGAFRMGYRAQVD